MTATTNEAHAEAWLVEWTETEVGWGQRADGAWYYPTEEAAATDTERMLTGMRELEKGMESRSRKLPMEFSRPELPPRRVAVSPELAKEIQEKGRAFRNRAEKGGVWPVEWAGSEEE